MANTRNASQHGVDGVDTGRDRGATVQSTEVNNSVIEDRPSLVKRTRRATRNIAMRKRKVTCAKLAVTIPPSHRRPVGENSQAFITESGVVCRMNSPIPTVTWKFVPVTYKNNMWKELEEKFELAEEQKEAVMHQLGRHYTQWKHNLHKKFIENVECVPEGLSEENWETLCQHFRNDAKFQEASSRNKLNRAKQSAAHSCGTKSFARVEMEMTVENGGVPPPAEDFWQATHMKNNGGGWIDERAENIMDQLQEVTQNLEEGAPPLELAQHFSRVLPSKSGYQVGRGWGPRPANRIPRQNRANEEARQHRLQLEDRIQELEAQLQLQNAQRRDRDVNIEETIQAQVDARISAYFERLHLFSRPSSSGSPAP